MKTELETCDMMYFLTATLMAILAGFVFGSYSRVLKCSFQHRNFSVCALSIFMSMIGLGLVVATVLFLVQHGSAVFFGPAFVLMIALSTARLTRWLLPFKELAKMFTPKG